MSRLPIGIKRYELRYNDYIQALLEFFKHTIKLYFKTES